MKQDHGAGVRSRLAAGALAAALLLAFLGSCATYDPNVFDRRLRTVTFRAYVGAIEAQFGGLDAAGVSARDLRERYRSRAEAAETPSAFYSVLAEMLADLDDPHAVLRVSPRFWDAPVAEPEWTQFVSSRGGVWVGLPSASIRRPFELEEALGGWRLGFGGAPLDELKPREVAAFLRRSAAFQGREGAIEARRPLEWLRLITIDGVAVETPHDAELLVRGALGSVVRFGVEVDGVAADLALIRNAGVFEAETEARGVRRRFSPLELAAILERGKEPGTRPVPVVGRAPLSAARARRGAINRSAFRSRRPIPIPDPMADAFGVEAWRLKSPDGHRVAYLRIDRFEPRGVDGAAAAAEESSAAETPGVRPRLDGVFRAAFSALRVRGWPGVDERDAVDHLIVDVSGNAGGSWVETGLLLSYFLPEDSAVVPHAVESVSDSGAWFYRTRTRSKQLLSRAKVPQLTPTNLFVLVDQSTASAGEITAATLRGVADATLIGERTAGAEYSTAEFTAPDGSVLRIGLGGGMQPPLPSFQGRGLEPDIRIEPLAGPDESIDLEAWRAAFRFLSLAKALDRIDEAVDKARRGGEPDLGRTEL
ncbi:MAG: S41 family peptidase [Planctomycetota bacterium]